MKAAFTEPWQEMTVTELGISEGETPPVTIISFVVEAHNLFLDFAAVNPFDAYSRGTCIGPQILQCSASCGITSPSTPVSFFCFVFSTCK